MIRDYTGMATLIAAMGTFATTIVSAILSLRNGWKADRNAQKADDIAVKVEDIHNATGAGASNGSGK